MSAGPTSAETTALLLESPRLLSVDEYHRMIEVGIFDVIEVFSDPDATRAAYRRTRTVASGENLASEALPQVSFPVAQLFG